MSWAHFPDKTVDFMILYCVWIKMIYMNTMTRWSMFLFLLLPRTKVWYSSNEREIAYVICNAFQSITNHFFFFFSFVLDLNCSIAFKARSSFTFIECEFSFLFLDLIRFDSIPICFFHCFLSLGHLVVLIVFGFYVVAVFFFRLMYCFNK